MYIEKRVGKTEPISYDVSLLYRVLIGIDRQIFNALKFPSSPIAAHNTWFYADRVWEQKVDQIENEIRMLKHMKL